MANVRIYVCDRRTGRGRSVCPFSVVRIISFNSTCYNIVSLHQAVMAEASPGLILGKGTRHGPDTIYTYMLINVCIISNCNCISYNGVIREFSGENVLLRQRLIIYTHYACMCSVRVLCVHNHNNNII